MDNQNNSLQPYVLGLDLGVASVGWAIRPLNPSDMNESNLKMGSRIFDLAVEDDIEKGKDMPKNAKRRAARSARRRLWRRARRKQKLFNLLVRNGMLPSGDYPDPEARQDMLSKLDLDLMKEYFPNATHKDQQTFTYSLRTLALDRELSPHAFGRALYALAQRRGFKSNKKLDGGEKAEDKETSQIKQEIAELEKNVEESARTLGEYFSRVNPEEDRIRARWVGRKSYYDEFQAIWTAQAKYRPDFLTPELKAKIEDAIFYQRPLKSQKGKIAKCELELDKDGKRYLPVARKGEPCFQQFRVWEKIINLRIWEPDGENPYFGEWRPLTRQEQDVAAVFAEKAEKVSYADLRKAFGYKKLPKTLKGSIKEAGRFNMEIAEDELIGDRTSARIWKVLNEFNLSLTQEEVDQAALYILDYESEDGLRKKLKSSFPSLTEEAADALAKKVVLEDGYAAYSSVALKKLLDYMKENRRNQMEAKLAVYTAQYENARDLLPPLEEAIGDVRNPTVARTLAEMRKVVNAIIRRYGKPAEIYVELARDLKRSRKEREKIFKNNNDRKKNREKIEEKLRKEYGVSSPTGRDVLKYRLWEECDGFCPYSGKPIPLTDLFGPTPHFDIEHIVPFSRSFDDSFANKTLCYADENRHVKKNMTPYECYGENKDKWTQILERVRKFKGQAARRKYELFTAQHPDNIEEFSQSCLNDSRYIAKLAMQYLGALFGASNGCVGVSEEGKGKRVIFASTGKVTAWIRREWKLNEILAEGGGKGGEGADVEKNRADHRHHAIDALVISLSTAKIVKELNDAAKNADSSATSRLFTKGMVLPPVTDFKDLVEKIVAGIVVSKRVDSKVRGALHEETNLGAKTYPDPFTKKQQRKKRVPVTGISAKQLDSVVDPGVRKAIEEKLKEVGDAKKFADNPPRLPSRNNNFGVLIVKTAVWETNNPIRVGKGRGARFVKPGANHHVEFYAILDSEGKEIEWRFNLVTLFEAYQRKREHRSVVNREFGENTLFKFSLVKGDAIREKATGKIYFVTKFSFSNGGKGIDISAVLNTCAKKQNDLDAEIKQQNATKRDKKKNQTQGEFPITEVNVARYTTVEKIRLTSLKTMQGFEKVRISPLGDVERSRS